MIFVLFMFMLFDFPIFIYLRSALLADRCLEPSIFLCVQAQYLMNRQAWNFIVLHGSGRKLFDFSHARVELFVSCWG